MKCNQEPFSDIRVRIALQKAINLEEVSTEYYHQDELVLPSLWDSTLAGWSALEDWDDELLDEYTYDPEAAKALLAEAGYPNGFEFTVAIDPSGDADLYELAKGYFAAIGVTMNIEVLADMAAGREVQGDSEDTRQFSIGMGGATDAGFAYQTYASDGFAYCFFNYDTDFDAMLKAVRDASSPSEQAAAAKVSDLYFSQQHTIIAVSGASFNTEFYSSRVGGNHNGELLSGSHFTKAILPRLWVNE